MASYSFLLRRTALTAFLVGHLAIAGCAQGLVSKLPAGADLQLGGSGSGPGQFADLRDTTFDARGQLWTLEGPTTDVDGNGTYPGNSRVQVFDGNGQFVRQFPLGVAAEPAHIAVNNAGVTFVSFPTLDRVFSYDRNGRKSREFTVPNANGLTSFPGGRQNAIANAIAAIGGFALGKAKSPVADRVYLLDDADPPTSLALARPLERVADLSADGAGNLYAVANVNSIYVFGPDGKLKKTIGAGTATRAKDGSELRSSVAVAPNGEIYAIANTMLAKFDATGKNVTRREGVFAWYENWNISILALDPSGRLWATSPDVLNSKTMQRYHYRPVILRLNEDFFAEQTKGTLESSLEGVGLRPQISSAAPLGVAFDLKPFRVNVAFPAANRGVASIDGIYRVYDATKNLVTQGRFNLPLRDGVAAQTSFAFTPPRYGAYSADVALQSAGKTLTRVGANFGVTQNFANLSGLQSEAPADLRSDSMRQMFAGLPAVRLSVEANPRSWDALENSLAIAERSGAKVWVQFPNPKDAAPDVVRAVAQRFKGRVKVYEIVNEPDLQMKAPAYLDILRPAVQAIRRADPNAQIMGPACVNIKLPWYKEFFEGGGAGLVDIVSFHDYQGNESIDPTYWAAIVSSLRDLMKENGIGDKPLWQTERAIPAVRANVFSGLLQAIRINAHDDVLQTLGIPAENNLHYYLNESGYTSVPSYLWSEHGPHPAVFVLRTRYALTKGHRYVGSLDFGDGNSFFSGLRYASQSGEVVALRTQGTAAQRVRFAVRGATNFTVIDSWGNESQMAANGGVLALELGQLPTYVVLPRGSGLNVAKLDLGRNIASQARFSYSGQTKSDFGALTDGVLQTIHGGIMGSNARGSTVWRGDLPDPGIENDDSTLQNPPALSLTFPNARAVSAFVVYGLPSDNAFSALLDFDVQARRGNNWQTVGTVRSSDPTAEMVGIAPTLATSWASDTSSYVVRLAQPVTAREWRLVPRRTTFGVAFDATAARAMKQTASKTVAPALWLREIEVYGE